MKACPDGWCINKKLFCDGHDDCEDGFDEIGCLIDNASNVTCAVEEFQCTSDPSMCVKFEDVCNDIADCPKGEDERNCQKCSANRFHCDNDQCINSQWVCDGKVDNFFLN